VRPAIAFVVAVSACHHTTTPPLDKADLASAFIDAECTHLVKCKVFPDSDSCHRAYIGINFVVDATQFAAIDAGKVIYDGVAARECIDSYATASCDRTDESARISPEACDRILEGTMGAGASCALDNECVSKSCDIPVCVVQCCRGACTSGPAPTRQPVGGSCLSAPCAAGTYCDLTSEMCVPLVALNGSCMQDYQCVFGLACFGGSCAAAPIVGQTCTTPISCRDLGTTCNQTTKQCIDVGLPGAACTTAADCSQFYQCDATGHCAEGSGLGGPCMSSNDCFPDQTYCAIPTGQTAGMCAASQPDGGTCTDDRECASDHCEDTMSLCTPVPMCI
jgi:hypothetical protein